MQIQWLGQSCFKIQAKSGGQDITILTDPFNDDIGLKMPKTEADIVTISHDHPDHNNLDSIKGEPFVVVGPGEYETKGVFIYGIPTWHDAKAGTERGPNSIYHISVENVNLVHLGDLGHDLTDEQLERMNSVDILFIPVGGVYTIDAKKAADVVSQIEPRLVVPMHYKVPGLKIKLGEVEAFVKSSGLPAEKMEKLKIAKKDLLSEETKIVLLTL